MFQPENPIPEYEPDRNNFIINVQRVYAKISLRITADGYGVNTSNSYVGSYESSEADGSNLNFAMCTENGTEYPQLQDKATYAIVGGTYAPANVVTGVLNRLLILILLT